MIIAYVNFVVLNVMVTCNKKTQKKRGINMPDEFYVWMDRCPVKIVDRDFDKYVWKYTFLIPIEEKEDTDG